MIRLPKEEDWNGKLVVTGAPGVCKQYALDFIISDFVLSRGYASTGKGNTSTGFYDGGSEPGGLGNVPVIGDVSPGRSNLRACRRHCALDHGPRGLQTRGLMWPKKLPLTAGKVHELTASWENKMVTRER